MMRDGVVFHAHDADEVFVEVYCVLQRSAKCDLVSQLTGAFAIGDPVWQVWTSNNCDLEGS